MGLQVSDSKPPKCLKKESHHHTVSLDLSATSTNHNEAIFERNKIAVRRINTSNASSTTAKFLMKETLPLRHQINFQS